MSHIKLTVLVKTDGAEFADYRREHGAFGLVDDLVLDQVRDRLRNGSHHAPLYDTAGTNVGVLDLSEVID